MRKGDAIAGHDRSTLRCGGAHLALLGLLASLLLRILLRRQAKQLMQRLLLLLRVLTELGLLRSERGSEDTQASVAERLSSDSACLLPLRVRVRLLLREPRLWRRRVEEEGIVLLPVLISSECVLLLLLRRVRGLHGSATLLQEKGSDWLHRRG